MSDTEPQGTGGTSSPARAKTRRAVKIALAFSLALNVMVIGLVTGALLVGGRPGDDGSGGLRSMGLGPFSMSLSREARNELRARLDDEQVRNERHEIGRSMRDLQRVLRAEPFDRAAADDALARTRAAAGALQGQGHEALLEQLSEMSPMERGALADQLEWVLRRMSHGNRR